MVKGQKEKEEEGGKHLILNKLPLRGPESCWLHRQWFPFSLHEQSNTHQSYAKTCWFFFPSAKPSQPPPIFFKFTQNLKPACHVN